MVLCQLGGFICFWQIVGNKCEVEVLVGCIVKNMCKNVGSLWPCIMLACVSHITNCCSDICSVEYVKYV